MKIRILLFAVATLICSTSVPAQNLDSPRTVLGPITTCGAWTEARASKVIPVIVQLRNFASGFVSGANFHYGNDFLKGIDGDALSGWLDNYCQQHPLQSFIDSVTALTLELEKGRR